MYSGLNGSHITPDPISISFHNVSYHVDTKKEKQKKILNNISGYVPAGSFLAILGPSGAGKSTLLDVLAGRNKTGKVSGKILFNSAPRPNDFQFRSAYVMQDDCLLGNLTVEETLLYTLDLRVNNSSMSKIQRKNRIQSLLADLNLSKVKSTKVGSSLNRGISGGERKRLSIGVEMVTGPKLVFLDEPTTGLDSHNALRVMKSLKLLCKKHQVTVICTIHQPRSNIFHLFDNFLLLESGETVYYGPDPVYYFSQLGLNCPKFMNPADFVLDLILQQEDETIIEDNNNIINDENELSSLLSDVISDKISYDDEINNSEYESKLSLYSAEELKEKFKTSDDFNTLNNTLDSYLLTSKEYNQSTILDSTLNNKNFSLTPRVSKFTQTRVLLARTWKDTIRDSNVVYVRTFAALFISLLVGLIFFQLPDNDSSDGNRVNSILFLMCVFSLFCLPAIGKFIEDRVVFTREHASGFYSTLPYCIASFLCELPILIITVLVYGIISYFMVGYAPGFGHFVFYILVIFTVIQVGYGSCQVIASIVKTTNVAIAIYVLFLVYSLLLGGFIIPKDSLPSIFQWLIYTSYYFYGFAALIVNEFGDRSYGSSVLSGFELQDTNKYLCWLLLFILWIIMKIIEYICLRFLNKEKR